MTALLPTPATAFTWHDEPNHTTPLDSAHLVLDPSAHAARINEIQDLINGRTIVHLDDLDHLRPGSGDWGVVMMNAWRDGIEVNGSTATNIVFVLGNRSYDLYTWVTCPKDAGIIAMGTFDDTTFRLMTDVAGISSGVKDAQAAGVINTATGLNHTSRGTYYGEPEIGSSGGRFRELAEGIVMMNFTIDARNLVRQPFFSNSVHSVHFNIRVTGAAAGFEAGDPYNGRVYVQVRATAGNYKLIFDNGLGSTQTTGNIAWNASPGTLRTAVEALSNVPDGSLSVTQDGEQYEIRGMPTVNGTFTADMSGLTGVAYTRASTASIIYWGTQNCYHDYLFAQLGGGYGVIYDFGAMSNHLSGQIRQCEDTHLLFLQSRDQNGTITPSMERGPRTSRNKVESLIERPGKATVGAPTRTDHLVYQGAGAFNYVRWGNISLGSATKAMYCVKLRQDNDLSGAAQQSRDFVMENLNCNGKSTAPPSVGCLDIGDSCSVHVTGPGSYWEAFDVGIRSDGNSCRVNWGAPPMSSNVSTRFLAVNGADVRSVIRYRIDAPVHARRGIKIGTSALDGQDPRMGTFDLSSASGKTHTLGHDVAIGDTWFDITGHNSNFAIGTAVIFESSSIGKAEIVWVSSVVTDGAVAGAGNDRINIDGAFKNTHTGAITVQRLPSGIVANNTIKTNTHIYIGTQGGDQQSTGQLGHVFGCKLTANTSFGVISLGAGDSRKVSWMLVDPAE